ncbi:MAG TPA: PSD1 and planctomycete cytochrome C domain-containing protein, partial [Chthoniobacteraceae bacterium]
MQHCLTTFILFGLCASLRGASPTSLPEKVEYNRDVRPIFADNCFKCHGFDKNARKADLRLDNFDGATAPDKDGIRAVVPKDLGQSELHSRIHSTDRDDVMPPPKSERSLTPRQMAILDRWIEQGAEYQPHWAYIAPTKANPPAVEEAGFVKNPIDQFVLGHLREAGLQHAPEADRATLCRRVYLDLLGLPPKPEEVDAFLHDASPDAYERLVDKLLASPHFGERLAIYWLDLVRYADSIGYHSDNPRNVWPYRDWVIQAFNQNERFDQFTIEQLAGDLLPNATLEQKVASAFNRLNMTTEEGGAQAKEYEAKTVADRVRAIGTVWLAQTFMCAECHDHKYDPFTSRDFYSLGAFFADIKESAIGRREDGMLVPTAEQTSKLKDFDGRIAELQRQLGVSTPELAAAQAAWEKSIAAGPPELPWTPLHPEKATGDKGSQLIVRDDQTIKVEVAGSPAIDTYRLAVSLPKGASGLRLEVLPSQSLPSGGPGRAGNGNFVLTEFSVEQEGKQLKLSKATATFEQEGYPAKNAIDGVTNKKENGWAVMGNTGNPATAYFQFEKPLVAEGSVTVVMQQRYGDNHTIGKFRLSATTAAGSIEAPNAGIPPEVLAAAKLAPEQRTAEQRAKLAEQFHAVAPELAPLRAKISETQKERDDFDKAIGRCLVSEHTDSLRTVRIRPRGNWQDDSGDIVQPAVPHFLPQPQVEAGRRLTRLDLGKWLVDRRNPLTARVFTNRLWKLYFGIGLCKTLEDLGTQGEVPQMQPLLDWLACEFMESGWDVKHVVRLMVTSGVY